MKKYSLINFEIHGDSKGKLVALENGDNIPFNVKRVYYIFNTQPDITRGCHAHRNLEQVIVCVSGSCDFILDDGEYREIIHLDAPNKGLYTGSNIWREFTNFSSDCIVLVLASDYYDENDYIRDYGRFLELVGERNH